MVMLVGVKLNLARSYSIFCVFISFRRLFFNAMQWSLINDDITWLLTIECTSTKPVLVKWK